MRTLTILFLLGLVLCSRSIATKAKVKEMGPHSSEILKDLAKPSMPETNLIQTAQSSSASLAVTSMTIAAPAGSDATLDFTSGANTISATLASDGSFQIQNSDNENIIEIATNNDVTIGASLTTTQSLAFTGSLSFGSTTQWRMVVNENFWSPPTGWSNNEITTCGGAYLLGGYCVMSRGQEQKTYSGLPAHTTIRITATWHYIDAWNGETSYLQLNVGPSGAQEYVWTDRYDSTMAVNSINICGATYGEGRFAVPIEVYIPHTSDSITVTFGSTVDQDPCDQSWGISNLSVYIM